MMHFTTLHVWCLVPAAAITAAQSASELFMHPANRRGCRYCFKHTGLLTALKKCKYLSPYLGSKHSACYRIYGFHVSDIQWRPVYSSGNVSSVCSFHPVQLVLHADALDLQVWVFPLKQEGMNHAYISRQRGPIQLLQSNPKSNSIQF